MTPNRVEAILGSRDKAAINTLEATVEGIHDRLLRAVRIHVEDGVAYVDEVPLGVVVHIVDYDVHAEMTTEHDEFGRPCSTYSVTRETGARRIVAGATPTAVV